MRMRDAGGRIRPAAGAHARVRVPCTPLHTKKMWWWINDLGAVQALAARLHRCLHSLHSLHSLHGAHWRAA